jgi:hypothetical protein
MKFPVTSNILAGCMALLLLSPAQATANTSKSLWFTCDTKNNKRIEVYSERDTLYYQFTNLAKGKVELKLSLPRRRVHVETHARGVSVNFTNKSYIYSVGAYRGSAINPDEAAEGVWVFKGEEFLTSVNCAQYPEVDLLFEIRRWATGGS